MINKQTELRIRISQLSEGVHSYQFLPSPAELELDESFQEPVEMDASLDKTQRQLYLRVKAKAKGTFYCDRCTEKFQQVINSSYSICYVYEETPDDSLPEDELRVIHIGTPYIELAEDTRQMIMLAIPLKLLCKVDCQGLCPHCGVNWNTKVCNCHDEQSDSRWDVLRNLITENN